MKKIILSAAILAVAGFTTVHAQTITKPVTAVVAQQDSTQKTAVKLDALPEAVKTTLKADAFKDWVPSGAFLVKTATAMYYEVDVTKGSDAKAVKISADGKIIS
jgi:hypothetical protein